MLKEKSTKERSTPVKKPSNNTTSMSSTQPIEKINLDENKALLLLNHLNKISNYLELAEMYDIKNV